MKTALIGLGRIGWSCHIKEIHKHDGYSLCAVVDPNPARLDEAYKEYGVRGYLDYHEMLQKEKPEIVIIASPTVFHEEQTIAALRAGIHVLLDKPMTIGMESAHRIEEAVKETGKKLVVYQPHRTYNLAVAAKQIISTGVLGKIYEIRRSDHNYVRRNDWQAFREFGGGMLNNYGTHYIDQLLYLTEEKVEDIYCTMKKIASAGDAEDVVKVILTTEKGTLLSIDINQASSICKSDMVIFGEYGTAWIDKNAKGETAFHLKYFMPEDISPIEVSKKLEAKGRKYPSERLPWKEEWINLSDVKPIDFYGACLKFFNGEGPTPVKLEDTLEVMRIMEKCRSKEK